MPQQVPKDQNSASVPADRQTLILAPSTASILVSELLQLTVSGATGAVKFSTNRAAVATVSKNGMVRGRGQGVAVITAKSGPAYASSTITVGGPAPPDPIIPPTAQLALINLTGNTTADLYTFVTAGTQANGGATLLTGSLDFGDGTPLLTWSGTPPVNVDHQFETADTYTATLSVTDSNNRTSTATVQAVVNPVPDPPDPPINQSPIAVLSYQSGQYINQPYVFSTSGTRDPDGPIDTWTFTPGDGGAAQGGSGNPPSTLTHTYTAAGSWTASFSVADAAGLTSTVTLVATVSSPPPPPQNQPPQVTLGFISGGTVGQLYVVQITATDPDGTVVGGTILWGDGQSSAYLTPGNYSHGYQNAGQFLIQVTVTDNQGLTGQATQTASIAALPPPNQPPVPQLAQVGTAVSGSPASFSTAGTTDPDGTIVSGLITWGDGTTTPITGAPAPTYPHTFTGAGTRTVTFQVTDNVGATASTAISVSVSSVNQPPVAAFVKTGGTFAGDLFQFSTVGTVDQEGAIAFYAINYGDGLGESASSPPPTAPSHVYATAGTFTATLLVRDSGGLEAQKAITVTVQTAPPPPGGGTPLSRNEHPRLCMTLADLPSIGTTCSAGGGWTSSFQSAVTDIENNYWGGISTSDSSSLVYGISMAGLVYNLRKAGVISGITFTKTNAEWLTKGVAWTAQLSTNILTLQPARQVAHVSWYFWVCGYDWLHDGIDGATRTQYFSQHCIVGVGNDSPFNLFDAIVGFKAAAVGTAAGNNPRQWSAETMSRGFSRMITAALALQHDNLSAGGVNSNTWATEQINLWYDASFEHLYDGILNRESQRGGTDGSAIQGFGTYGQSYDHNWIVTMAWAWRPAQGLTKSAYYGASSRSYLRGMIPYYYYMLRQQPHGSNKLYLKDLYSNADTHAGEFETQMQMGHARAELQGVDDNAAALAAYFIANKGIDSEKRWVFSRFLAPPITALSPAAVGLSLSKAFLPGQWQFRSGWLSNSDTVVNIWGYEFVAFNSAVGNFSIDYRGPAVITPGFGGHDFDTSWHGGGVNTLGCPETNRTTIEASSAAIEDFGFHRVYSPRVPDFIQNTVVDWLDRTERFHAADATDDYGYLWLDRTRSFNGDLISDGQGNALKVPTNSVYRQFVTFQPAAVGTDPLIVFVFDQMTVKSHSPAFQKRNHLYYSGTPTVSGAGGSSAGPSRGDAGTTGKTTYTGGTPLITATMTADGCDNKTWVQPFCQTAAFDVVLVECRRFNALIGWEYEDPYGRLTAGSSFSADIGKYGGFYRTEIIPTTSNLTDRFGTVIVVAPSAASAPTISDWSGTNFQAYRANARAAAMGTTQNGTTSGTILCKEAGTFTLAIGNLPASTLRSLAGGGNISSITRVGGGSLTANAVGVLYVTVVVTTPGTGAANTLTVS